MKKTALAIAALAVALGASRLATAERSDTWAAYLDYAFVYSSADPKALRERLDRYARESGVSLSDYLAEELERDTDSPAGEAAQRRRAVAHLLDYLASGRGESLQRAVRAVDELRDRLERHENRYWYHYVHAHEALANADAPAFVRQVLDLWFRVVVPLEVPYQTYQTLSLDQSGRVGFAAAVPYLYENVARLVLIRSQQMGMDHGLDALASVVRFLAQDRLGAYPEVIPAEASARPYLDRILARLDGPESDGGRLTFTLALFEAGKHHDRARSLLASDGFTPETLDAIRVSTGAYETALRQARTLQGQAAVYTRVLRQQGEILAAKQRLGVDPDIEIPFSIERAMHIYAALHEDLDSGWERHGYRDHGRDAYLTAMRDLWQEIQEASFNTAEYYLARGIEQGREGNESLSAAARAYAAYLDLYDRYAAVPSQEAVPDSAYFASYWAAKGIADSILSFDGRNPSSAQIDEAIGRYREALARFPFDPSLWSAIATSLERQGRDAEYLALTKEAAERVARSRALQTWIDQGRAQAQTLDGLRRALADDLVIMYLGFADASTVDELEQGLAELRARRDRVQGQLADLRKELQDLRARRAATLSEETAEPPPANLPPVSSSGSGTGRSEISRLNERIESLSEAQARLDDQIEARSRALPLFRQALRAEDLVTALVTQRDHPLHGLVRRMVFEGNDS